MPRSFDMATEYGGSVEQVHRAFSDERYWLARLTDSGADDYSLNSLAVDEDGGIDVVTSQRILPHRLPGIVQQFHRGELRVLREETWRPICDGRATAAITLTIDGAPATLSGSADLVPLEQTGRSRLDFHAEVEVRVPLVGGKIENFIGSQLINLLIAEQRFTTVWISENA